MRPVDWLAVALLLLFAASLRIIGIDFGQLQDEYFPSYAPHGMAHDQLLIQPDEFLNVAIPVNMALRNQRNPEFFNYPTFIINVNLALNWLTGALDGQTLAEREGKPLRAYAGFPLYVSARMLSVLGGMLQVACAYAIARMAGGRFAALGAGLLVAVSFTLVQHAHYAKPGSLASGWMMLSAWAGFAALCARRRHWRNMMWLLACVSAGLAVTTRYNALAITPLLAFIGAILLYRHPSRRRFFLLLLGALLVPLVFFLGSPFVLLDFEHFWREFSQIVRQYTFTGEGIPDYFLVDHIRGLGYLIMYTALFAIGVPALLLAGVALLAAWFERPRRQRLAFNSRSLFSLLIALVIALYSVFALRTVRPGHSDQLLILILPFVALLSGLGAGWLAEQNFLPTRLMLPLLALLLASQPLILSVQVVRLFSLPDTRQLMLAWIHDNIPPGASFYINGPYNVPLDEAIYPNNLRAGGYATPLPSAADFDYLIYSDARAFDILRSAAIVPPEIIERERAYLRSLDAAYPQRIAQILRPSWTGSEAMINMAAYWHNPTLILYCLHENACAPKS